MLSVISRYLLNCTGKAIRIYQHTLSPDHGLLKKAFPYGLCRFTPTCSEYARQAIHLHKWKGIPMIFRRLLKCHPFSWSSHHDPVPTLEHRKLSPPTP